MTLFLEPLVCFVLFLLLFLFLSHTTKMRLYEIFVREGCVSQDITSKTRKYSWGAVGALEVSVEVSRSGSVEHLVPFRPRAILGSP